MYPVSLNLNLSMSVISCKTYLVVHVTHIRPAVYGWRICGYTNEFHQFKTIVWMLIQNDFFLNQTFLNQNQSVLINMIIKKVKFVDRGTGRSMITRKGNIYFSGMWAVVTWYTLAFLSTYAFGWLLLHYSKEVLSYNLYLV